MYYVLLLLLLFCTSDRHADRGIFLSVCVCVGGGVVIFKSSAYFREVQWLKLSFFKVREVAQHFPGGTTFSEGGGGGGGSPIAYSL